MTQNPQGGFTLEYLRTMRKGLELFNQKLYWECHEELEHHWLESRGDPVRLIYWAVIQVAATLVHYQKDNISGARGLLTRTRDKFEKIEQAQLECPLLEQSLSWGTLKKLVFDIPDDPQIADFKKLYDFEFNLKFDGEHENNH